MRTFLALPLPPELARKLCAAAHAALGPRLEELRLVRPDNLHLTLHFLGVTSAEVLARLPAELELALAGRRAPQLAIRGSGGFPAGSRKHVLWAGVAGEPRELEELGRLVSACRAALAASGHPLPDSSEPFVPHVTLARSRDGLAAPRAWRELEFDFAWRAARIDLLESEAGAGRTRHPSLWARALD